MIRLPDRVAALVFDVDDTLVATTAHWHTALAATCARVAAHTPAADPLRLAAAYEDLSDALWTDIARSPAPPGPRAEIRRRLWERALASCDVTLPAHLVRELVDHFAESQRQSITPDPAVTAPLAELSRILPLAVCTNGSTEQTETKLGRAGLLPFFRAFVCAEDTALRKPDPEVFRRACRAVDAAPGSCLFVGDDWENDIAGAHRAGLHPVWITTSTEPRPYPVPRRPDITSCLADLRQALTPAAEPTPSRTPTG